MKNFKMIAIVLSCVFLASCDANKSKVNDATKQFIQAVIDKDKVTFFELYPNSRVFNVLSIPDTLTVKDLSMEFNKEDSFYVAKLNDKQALVLKSEDGVNFQIQDSYNVLRLDSTAYELAAATGVPLNKLSDMSVGKLFVNDGDFIGYLKELYPSAANGNLYHSNGRYNWRGGAYPTVQFDLPVTNGGEKEVKGSEYNMEVIYTRRDTGDRVGTSVEDGRDLAPGETQVFTIFKNELYYYANGVGLYCHVSFVFKNTSTSTMLARYGSFTGKEYEEFLKAQEEAKKEKTEKDKQDKEAEPTEKEISE